MLIPNFYNASRCKKTRRKYSKIVLQHENLQQPTDKPLKTSNRQLPCDHDTGNPSQNNLFQNTLTLDTKNNNNNKNGCSREFTNASPHRQPAPENN